MVWTRTTICQFCAQTRFVTPLNELLFKAIVDWVCVWLGVMVLDVAFLALVRAGKLSRNSLLATVALFFWIFVGLVILGPLLAPLADPRLKIGAVAFYLAACLLYMEARSILSRGYSLRILVDLDKLPGRRADRKTLKDNYGGMGVTGLLAKRVRTLADFRMLVFAEHRVGPLTWAGWCMGYAGLILRKSLCLHDVG